MIKPRRNCDVLIIGAGPAGLAAATSAAESGMRVTIIDDNPGAGGQIWRGEHQHSSNPEAAKWVERVRQLGVECIHGAMVFDRPSPGLVVAETFDGLREFGYQSLILATGARERFLPFPGWTLPNVCGAGGLQALAKTGLPVEGKRIVVAGTGPLLMAVSAYLRKRGAKIVLIAEQAALKQLLKFGLRLLMSPAKAAQAAQLRRQLAGVPYLPGCWVTKAEGVEKLTRVSLRQGQRTWDVACDYLACGFHLSPNIELAALIGCVLTEDGVSVDELQQTSVDDVYCAGETSGIGGLELSLIEGRIAGYAATGRRDLAARCFSARRRLRRFAVVLNRTFSLREELRSLAGPDTLVCRCEDVSLGVLSEHAGWREAKLHTRCGMGPCQGRVCGAAIQFLLGWKTDSVRPPVFPVRLGSLAQAAALADSNTEVSQSL